MAKPVKYVWLPAAARSRGLGFGARTSAAYRYVGQPNLLVDVGWLSVRCRLCGFDRLTVKNVVSNNVCVMTAVKSSSVQCGIRPSSSRIIGGQDARPHTWPWQCSLQRYNLVHFCGCSIVNRYWVITAAHCLYVCLSICLSLYLFVHLPPCYLQ